MHYHLVSETHKMRESNSGGTMVKKSLKILIQIPIFLYFKKVPQRIQEDSLFIGKWE